MVTRRGFLTGAAGAPFLRAAPDGAPAWPRYVSPMALDLRIPQKHPYLTLSPSQIEHAKQRAAASPLARQQLDRIIADADGLAAKPWDQLPPQANVRHRALGGNLFSVGMAYAFSGDKRYAEWVREGLLAYATFYSGLPLTEGRYRLFHHMLYESRWVGTVVQAYDMVASSGVFTVDQARHVEEDLLRLGTKCVQIVDFDHDPRLKDLHFRCYNFQAWHIAAVGLAGLALRDKDMVDWAVNSPYGFRHTVARDVRDDGMFWERSEGYHNFVIEGLLGFTEAMRNCGVDLYNVSVPTDRMKDEDENYLTDTSDRPKSLRMMFEPLFYMTFPDLSYPVLGDAGPGPLRSNPMFLVASNRYRDPRIDWLVYRDSGRASRNGADWHELVYDVPSTAPAAFPVQEGRFANTGEHRNGCTLFPATGLAILRQASGDYTTQPDSTAVSLSYGPHGGGHGHSNNMDLVLYAHGRQWIPAFGSMPYETQPKYDWTAQTISNNTVVVDGISQKPTGTRHTEWPQDRATDRVCGVLEGFDAASKSVSAHCDNTYPDVRLRRALRLQEHLVVDAFRVTDAKGAQHQYDYVLHIDGRFDASSTPLEPRSGKLGQTCGYPFVDQKQRGTVNGSFTLTFSNNGKQLRVWVAGDEATEVIIADGLTNSPDRRMTMLVLRRKAADTGFLAVFEPVNPGDAVNAVRIEKAELVIESPSGTRRLALE
ncbi:exported hypothetical protein [Candidatus Sulfopaludibacter sp. SbA3]|nr:exported hypothetical protein [Candidatus Sulfopaludibacter sp. SbA3]